MKTLFIIFIVFLVAMLQATFVPKIAIYGVFPNLMLVLVIFKSLFKEYKEIFIWPLAGGIILDINSQLPFGIFTLSFLIISLMISFLSRNIWSSEFIGLVVVLITFLGSLLSGLLTIVFSELGYLFMNLPWVLDFKQLMVVIFSQAVYNVILAVIFLLVLRRLRFSRQNE